MEAGKSEMKKKKKNQVTSIQLGLPRKQKMIAFIFISCSEEVEFIVFFERNLTISIEIYRQIAFSQLSHLCKSLFREFESETSKVSLC